MKLDVVVGKPVIPVEVIVVVIVVVVLEDVLIFLTFGFLLLASIIASSVP